MAIETLTHYQQERALKAHQISQRFLDLDEALRKSQKPSVLVRYGIEAGTFRMYEVTPRVLFGMFLVQRSLIKDLLEYERTG